MPQPTVQLRRSVLFMPGSNTRALEKSRELPADVLVFDLEDSVAPEQKVAARDNVTAAVRAGGYGRRDVVLRVNDSATEWSQADLRAAATGGFSGVMLPKVESGQTLEHVRATLLEAGAPDHLPLWIMVETPRGVLELGNILAGAGAAGLGPVVMGTTDLASELNVSPLGTRPGLTSALSLCVLAARAHGLDIIDGVHLDLQDHEGFAVACKQGRELGFSGKSLIHPSQIDPANAAFGVSKSAAERARAVLAAWDAARASGSGMAVVQGQLVEVMHVEKARRTLALFAAANN